MHVLRGIQRGVQISLQQARDLFFHQEEISQHLLGKRIWWKFHYSQKLVDVSRKKPLNRKLCLDSTYFGLKTMRQVPLYLSGLAMNWTSSFLVHSDTLAIVLHLLLAPVGTVVKPAEHQVVRRLSPTPGRCRDAFCWVIGWRCDRQVEGQGFDT